MIYIVTLIFVGLLLLLIEIILIPGFAITGILGLGALAGSYFYADKTFGEPASTIVLIIDVLLVTALTIYVLRAKTWKRFQLKTGITSKAGTAPADCGIEVGDKGHCLSRLAPMGTAVFGGKSYEVKSLEGFIEEGEEVEVAVGLGIVVHDVEVGLGVVVVVLRVPRQGVGASEESAVDDG